MAFSLAMTWSFFITTGVLAQFTNLPDVPPGVFNVSSRLEIHHTNLSSAWGALTDFPLYPTWNPFVRSSIVVSPANITLPNQRPVENTQLILRVQIPPLPLPVNEYTPDDPLNTQVSYENVTHVQPELGRLAWAFYFKEILDAERWQALSDLGGGRVLYESCEVYRGPLAELLRTTSGEGLQKAFDAQAQGLKLLLEGS
ncbi:hypothetical protein N0V90_013433 [Kalmusia sp. IMI 367209]|nr:hypothetical protein N0V90_013433 [Kalmusia sp. IMI 367209]